ncbi:NAD(P)/FAD-dependent oxidoreductase [Paraburkholderia aromaticivorans]|uniref:NAD(P)/FAD-dependent oxidoreductase n=1 Tax=Paraburkholderia aromaticivorans TaxID=2026199 RepID=UPI001456035E|nr:FAD-binding oxidoreductase [Paraburkholderia aromaticivorans]
MRNSVDRAEVVIVGGGLLGTSAAYHLTRAGVTDVLLLERGELATGASCRPAGFLNHTRSDVSTIRMIGRTRAAIKELEQILGESIGFHQHGCVRAAFSESREEEMRALESVMRGAGLNVHEIDRQEATARVPWLKLDEARRTIFVPEDGYADGALLASAYARAARLAGARIQRGIEVTGLLQEGGEVSGVMTSKGVVRARWVVCAAGAWEMALAASINFGFPGAPTRSHYWITAPDGTSTAGQPNVYLPDFRAYMRPEVGGLLIGLQEPLSRTYDPMQLEPDMNDMNLVDETADTDMLLEHAGALKSVAPRIEEWGFAHHISGLSVYTPDGKFVVGRPAGTEGLVVAGGCCGSGLAGSGGYGEVVASIITGQPSEIDASVYEPNRFGVVDPTSQAFRDRCAVARAGKSRGNLPPGNK